MEKVKVGPCNIGLKKHFQGPYGKPRKSNTNAKKNEAA
jgi:hypothetical protein